MKVNEKSNIIIGELIKQRMEQLKVTPVDMAKKLNISRQMIYNYMKGDYNFSLPFLCIIFEALGIEAEMNFDFCLPCQEFIDKSWEDNIV